MVDPAGPRAAMTANLWWFMLALGLGVYVLVMLGLAASLITRQDGRFQLPDLGRTRLGVFGGLVAPAIVLVVLIVADLRTLVAVAAPPAPADLTLEVVGHQWWWEVRYPDQHISTANEIHVPTNAIVLIHLGSVDVIHSLWVPRLAGKTDLVPGQTASMWLQADAPGEYRGQCAASNTRLSPSTCRAGGTHPANNTALAACTTCCICWTSPWHVAHETPA